jgi:hypothetical protein
MIDYIINPYNEEKNVLLIIIKIVYIIILFIQIYFG